MYGSNPRTQREDRKKDICRKKECPAHATVPRDVRRWERFLGRASFLGRNGCGKKIKVRVRKVRNKDSNKRASGEGATSQLSYYRRGFLWRGGDYSSAKESYFTYNLLR